MMKAEDLIGMEFDLGKADGSDHTRYRVLGGHDKWRDASGVPDNVRLYIDMHSVPARLGEGDTDDLCIVCEVVYRHEDGPPRKTLNAMLTEAEFGRFHGE